ncbi:MAG: enolase C-terminal domain-like protein, partial [Umezawaea sp.]
MKLSWSVHGLVLRTPLRISRSVMAARDAVQVVVEHGGLRGHGEVVTSVFYGLDIARITMLLQEFRSVVAGSASPEALIAELPGLDFPAGVLAAVDAALHDVVAQQLGQPVHALVRIPQWTDVATAYTIGITDPASAGAAAVELADRGFTVLKLKVGADQDIAAVTAVHAAAPGARLLLDPNGGWTPEQSVRVVEQLTTAGVVVDALEQPIAPGNPD